MRLPRLAKPLTAGDRRARQALVFLVRLAVVVALYVAIGHAVRFPEMRVELTAAVAYAMGGSILLTLMQAATCTLRWVLIARRLPRLPGFRVSFLAYLEGLFANQALPSFVGGDVVRVIRWRGHGVPVVDAVISVLLDRVYGIFGAACLALLAVAQLWSHDFPRTWLSLAAATSFGIVVAALLVFALAARRSVPGWLNLPGKPGALVRELSRFRAPARTAAACVVYSIVGQALAGLGVLMVARSIGIDVPAAILVTVTSLVVLVSMIPISLAGWGLREAGFLAVLAPLGVAPELAVLLGLLFGVQGLLASMIGGVSLLFGLASASRTDGQLREGPPSQRPE